MGFILFIVSIILSVILIPIGFVYTTFALLFRFKFKEVVFHWNKLFLRMAYSIDQFGNVACQHLFNDVLINVSGHKFGDADETVSYVLGKNKATKTLSKLGWWFANMLNKLDAEHVEKAVEWEEANDKCENN